MLTKPIYNRVANNRRSSFYPYFLNSVSASLKLLNAFFNAFGYALSTEKHAKLKSTSPKLVLLSCLNFLESSIVFS